MKFNDFHFGWALFFISGSLFVIAILGRASGINDLYFVIPILSIAGILLLIMIFGKIEEKDKKNKTISNE